MRILNFSTQVIDRQIYKITNSHTQNRCVSVQEFKAGVMKDRDKESKKQIFTQITVTLYVESFTDVIKDGRDMYERNVTLKR